MITGQQAAAISDLNPEVQWRHPRSGLISSMQELGRRYTQRTAAPESCKSQPVVLSVLRAATCSLLNVWSACRSSEEASGGVSRSSYLPPFSG